MTLLLGFQQPLVGVGSIIQLAVVLIVVGILWWANETQWPEKFPPFVKFAIRILLILLACLYLLRWGNLI